MADCRCSVNWTGNARTSGQAREGIEAEPIGVQARRPALARGGRQFVLEDVIGLLRSAELLAAPLEEAQVLQSNGMKQKIDNQDSHAGVDRPSGYR